MHSAAEVDVPFELHSSCTVWRFHSLGCFLIFLPPAPSQFGKGPEEGSAGRRQGVRRRPRRHDIRAGRGHWDRIACQRRSRWAWWRWRHIRRHVCQAAYHYMTRAGVRHYDRHRSRRVCGNGRCERLPVRCHRDRQQRPIHRDGGAGLEAGAGEGEALPRRAGLCWVECRCDGNVLVCADVAGIPCGRMTPR